MISRTLSARWAIAITLGLLAFVGSGASADDTVPPKYVKTTHIYKTVDDLKIQADLLRPDDDKIRPVVMWIHGGALIVNNRGGLFGQIQRRLEREGVAIFSIDYRLAPHTKVPELLTDVSDAYAWLLAHGEELRVDTRRVVVMGSSAGGYLTLTCGYRLNPRPAALVSFWGYGELTADWYSKPSEFYRQRGLIDEQEARRWVSGPPTTDGTVNRQGRGLFYVFCRQNGIWPQEVAGLDPATEDESFTPLCPARNVTGDYPPTMLIHGDVDTDVPHEESVRMDKLLTAAKVEHQFISLPGSGHGGSGGDPQKEQAAYDAALKFTLEHLSP